jgi:predicted nucleic acid-binding Zn ribbon protein
VRLLRQEVAPPTLLAQVQERWGEAVGPRVAGEAEPIGERDGVVTVGCRSAVWAAELSMLAAELEAGLNDLLGGAPRVRALRFVTRPR